jgi:hypothetical protein
MNDTSLHIIPYSKHFMNSTPDSAPFPLFLKNSVTKDTKHSQSLHTLPEQLNKEQNQHTTRKNHKYT